MGKDVIIALDFDGREKTLAFLDRFTGEKPFVKIGMELFYAEGPQIVRDIKARGHKIFLDLKLHYNAVLGTNADFYNMTNGAPSGILYMEGVKYLGNSNQNFFAILKDGTAVIGAPGDYAAYESQIQEAVDILNPAPKN